MSAVTRLGSGLSTKQAGDGACPLSAEAWSAGFSTRTFYLARPSVGVVVREAAVVFGQAIGYLGRLTTWASTTRPGSGPKAVKGRHGFTPATPAVYPVTGHGVAIVGIDVVGRTRTGFTTPTRPAVRNHPTQQAVTGTAFVTRPSRAPGASASSPGVMAVGASGRPTTCRNRTGSARLGTGRP